MAVTLNASTTAGLVTSADTSGNLDLQAGGVTKIAVTSAGANIVGTLTVNGVAPASGKVLQMVTSTLDGVVSTSGGGPTSISNGVQLFSTAFTPINSSSKILVFTSTIALSEETNNGDKLWLALWNGATFVSASSGGILYSHWPTGLNASYISICSSFDAGSTSTRTIQVRGGIDAGTVYINGNSTFDNYSGSSARLQMTVMEIAA